MIYSNGVIVKEPIDNSMDELSIKILELSLYTMRNYHESLQDALENEIRIKQGILQESFSFKTLCSNMGKAIGSFFNKVKEIFATASALIGSIWASSDQLISANWVLFKEKIDKYGGKIKYKIALPNPDMDILGSCGSEFSEVVYNDAEELVETIKSSTDVNNFTDIQTKMNEIRGSALGSGKSLSQKEFKDALDAMFFLEEKEYTGIDLTLSKEIIDVLNSSPENISRSWNKEFEKKTKELRATVKKLDKNEDISSALASYAISYISGCLDIISCIHTSFIKANVKVVRTYRSLFLKVIKTLK